MILYQQDNKKNYCSSAFKIGDCVIAKGYQFVWEIVGFHGPLTLLIPAKKHGNISKMNIAVFTSTITPYETYLVTGAGL